MQWVKRFWDQNYPGGEYDAVGRRKGGGGVGSVKSSPAVSRASAPMARKAAAGAGAGATAGIHTIKLTNLIIPQTHSNLNLFRPS